MLLGEDKVNEAKNILGSPREDPLYWNESTGLMMKQEGYKLVNM